MYLHEQLELRLCIKFNALNFLLQKHHLDASITHIFNFNHSNDGVYMKNLNGKLAHGASSM